MRPDEVKRAVVVGAGVMGHSIAQVFAGAGIEVGLGDLNERVLEDAMSFAENNLETLARCGKVDKDEIPAILARIHPSTDLAQAGAGTDFVLEAVVEVPEVKRDVFSKLDEICSGDTVFASNTSGLEIFEIAKVSRPERFVVAHWFAPPHIIPLVEVVPGPDTSPETVSFTAKLMERLGKRPIVMKQFVRSFIVNRIQNSISSAVMEMLLNGWATPKEIDLAVKLSLGIRLPIVGVVQSLDFTGLDLVYQMMQNYGVTIDLIEEKFKKGHLGAKTSAGIYDYGGRSESEILRKRDELYLAMLDHLEKLEPSSLCKPELQFENTTAQLNSCISGFA